MSWARASDQLPNSAGATSMRIADRSRTLIWLQRVYQERFQPKQTLVVKTLVYVPVDLSLHQRHDRLEEALRNLDEALRHLPQPRYEREGLGR
jgi:hypothetical protein